MTSRRSLVDGKIFPEVATAVTLWLLLIGIPLQSAVLALVVVVSIGSVGLRTLGFLLPKSVINSQSALWMFGPGIGIGSLLLFGLRAVTSKNWFLVISAGVCLALLVIEIAKLSATSCNVGRLSRSFQPREFAQITLTYFFLIGIPLMRMWPWVAPIVVSAALSVLILQRFGSAALLGGRSWMAVLFMTAPSIVISEQLRSDLWWMVADDNQFFEAISHSLIEWGPQERTISIAGSGVSNVAYHHLAYFLSGLIDLVVGEDTYTVLSRVAPVVVSACLVSSMVLVVHDLVSKFSQSPLVSDSRRVLAVSYVLALSVPSPMSNFLGLSVLASIVLMSRYIVESRRQFVKVALVFLLLTSLAFSKVPYLYAGVIVLVTSAVLGSVRSWVIVLSATVSAAVLLLFFSLSVASSDFRIDPFSEDSIFELSDGRGKELLGLIAVSAPLALGFAAGLATLDWRNSRRLRVFVFSSLIVLITGMALRLIVSGRIESIRYLYEPAVFFASLLVAVWHLSAGERLQRSSPGLAVGVAICVVATWLLVVPRVVPNLNSGSVFAKSLRIVRDPNFAQIVVAGLGVIVVLAQRGLYSLKQKSPQSDWSLTNQIWRWALYPVAAGVAIAVYLPGFVESISESRSGVQDADRREYVGSVEEIALAKVIRETAQRNELIAVSICDYYDNGCTTDYSLAAYSKRRFLSLGGTFVVFWGGTQQELLDYRTSSEMNSEPLERIIDYLRRRDVGYLAVDKTLVKSDWTDSMSRLRLQVLYQNSRYVLYKV